MNTITAKGASDKLSAFELSLKDDLVSSISLKFGLKLENIRLNKSISTNLYKEDGMYSFITELFISLYQHNVDELLEICIKKLKDSWYLIQCNNMNYSEMDPGPDFFICDEFEEIEGFLGAETTLRFL